MSPPRSVPPPPVVLTPKSASTKGMKQYVCRCIKRGKGERRRTCRRERREVRAEVGEDPSVESVTPSVRVQLHEDAV